MISVQRSDVLAICILALVTVGCFWKLIFTRDYSVMSFYDNSVQSYAWYQYLSEALAQRTLPLWDPYALGGHSFIGEIQSGAFYLPNLILAMIAGGERITTGQIEVLLIVHLFGAACFTYALGRYLGLRPGAAVLSATIFAFGGVVLGRLQSQTNIFVGLVWLPLALLCLEIGIRRGLWAVSGCAGLALAAALVAGHIQPPYHIAIALGLLTVCHAVNASHSMARLRALGAGAVALVVGGLASAVQLLPALEYGPLSLRAVGLPDLVPATARLPYSLMAIVSMHPSNLVSVLLPGLNRPPDTNPYLGLAAVVLAIVAIAWSRNPWIGFLVVLAAYGLLTALGDSSVLNGWEYALVPLSDRVREAARRMYLFQFAVAMLAGMGLECLTVPSIEGNSERARKVFRWLIYPVGAFLALGILATLIPLFPKPETAVQIREPLLHSALVGIALLGVVGSIATRRLGGRGATGILISVIVWDLLSANILLPTERNAAITPQNLYPERFYGPSPVIAFLVEHANEGRVFIQSDLFPPNIGDVYKFRTVLGHGATLVTTYDVFMNGGWNPRSKFSQLLGVRYYVAEKSMGADPPIVTDGALGVYSANQPAPQIWIVHDVVVVKDDSLGVAAINAPTFDIWKRAVVNTPSAVGAVVPPSSASLEHVNITQNESHRIVATASLSSPGLVVLSEGFYPGWNAFVDGHPSPIVQTDVALRGVFVPAGDHVVTYVYQPGSVKRGFELSFAAVLLLILGATVDLSVRSKHSRRTFLTGVTIAAVIAGGGLGLWIIADPLGERVPIGPTHIMFLDRLLGQASVQAPSGDVPPVSVLPSPDDLDQVVILQHPASSVTYDVHLPRRPSLEFGTQIDPRCVGTSEGAIFQVALDDGSGPVTIYHRELVLDANSTEANLLRTRIDLSTYSEHNIKLTTTTSARSNGNYSCAWAEWANPIILGD